MTRHLSDFFIKVTWFVTCHTLTNHYADWSGGCT